MRQRNNSSNGYSNWQPKYPTDGGLPMWHMAGYVQSVTENEKGEVDYVRFNIKQDPYRDFYVIFSVTIPWELDMAVDPGDAVEIDGTIRTWNKENGAKTIELIATHVEEWKK